MVRTSPAEKLDVNGNIKATGLIAGAVFSDKPADFWSAGASFFGVDNLGSLTTQGSYEVALTANGYRGAGSLWVSQNINSQTGAVQITLNPAGYMSFRTEAVKATGAGAGVTERMRITSSGNVGIGDTTPSYKLDVTGDIHATGEVISSSDARLKEDLEVIPDALDKVKQLSGYTFNKNGSEERPDRNYSPRSTKSSSRGSKRKQ